MKTRKINVYGTDYNVEMGLINNCNYKSNLCGHTEIWMNTDDNTIWSVLCIGTDYPVYKSSSIVKIDDISWNSNRYTTEDLVLAIDYYCYNASPYQIN